MAKNPWEMGLSEAPADDGPWNLGLTANEDKPKPSGIIRRAVGDTAVSLGKGIVGAGEAVVGLGDLATGGYLGKGLNSAFKYDPKATKSALDELYSPEQQKANQAVQQAEGFFPTAAAAIKNPSMIAQTIVESAPSMLAGGAAARGLGAVKSLASNALARGALGEGIIGAGQQAEHFRQENPDGTLSPKQEFSSLASGAGTAALAGVGGAVARKLGIADVDTMLAGGKAAAGAKQGLARRVGEGFVAEGVLEEMPQSVWEQGAQNFGNGKPLTEGMGNAAATGLLTGGLMGSGANVISRSDKPAATPEVAPADQSIPYAPTTVEEVAKQRADAMGVKPENGPISAAASLAIEGQAAEEMRLATPGVLAQGAAAAEQARLAQEARQAAEPGIPYEPVAVEAPQAAPIVPTVPMVDPQIPAQDWINQQTGVDQSSGVTRRDFEAAAKEQADPQTILDESGRPKTTTSALEIQQFHADFDRREALRQRNLSAAERLRAARGGKPLVEDAQPADVAPQPSAPVVDIAQPDIADEAPARVARPAPSPASGGSSAPAMPSVSSLVAQGATLQGKNLVDASNNVVLPNLNIQQYREANTLLKSKPNAQAAETPAPSVPVQAAPQGPKQQSAGVTPAQDISGDKINREWTSFAPETGTLAVPRAEMPQIKAEHRGAMANFMNARGVSHAAEEVRADSLRPTQAEFSPSKVKRAMKFQGGDRSILVSADNYVLDGHHQWLAKREAGEPIKVIRLNAPISDLISLAHDFPSSTMAGGATGKQSLQVQPENSNGNARPASETVPPVSPAQRGVNAGGVGNLRADRGSGTGGQAVRNDAAEPAASVPDSRAGGSGERVAEPVSKPYKLPLNLRDKNAALVEMASLMGKSDKDVRESFSVMWKRDGRESAEKRLVATVERLRAEKTDPKQDQPTQKESPASFSTESNPALESLFADLDSSTVRKANKAKKAAKLHPQAAEIDYVQNNYHDILIQLMDAGKLEVNGSKSVTEENKSCL